MKVLIIFASVEGQTRKIVKFLANEVKSIGHDAQLFDASDAAKVSYDGIDAVILAAPVHERRHPKMFEEILTIDAQELVALPTLLISVSLSAAFTDGLEDAQDYLIEMKMRTGFTPDDEMLVAGAVRNTKYDYFATQVIRHVVLRNRDYDPSVDEHEFTDWPALSVKIQDFIRTK